MKFIGGLPLGDIWHLIMWYLSDNTQNWNVARLYFFNFQVQNNFADCLPLPDVMMCASSNSSAISWGLKIIQENFDITAYTSWYY